MDNLEVGEIYPVLVTEVASHGISISYENTDGYIQIPELSWDEFDLHNRISEICKVGDVLNVKILSVTDDRFYASLRRAEEPGDPWKESSFRLGLVTTGNVVLVAEYGYLIKLENNLIAIMKSENQNKQYMKNDLVKIQVSQIDFERKKVEVIDIG